MRDITKRRLATDLAIRGFGAVLLGLCTVAIWWLYWSVHRPPAHSASVGELADGAIVVLCWASGWAALGEGQGLFRPVDLPDRYAHLDPIDKGNPS